MIDLDLRRVRFFLVTAEIGQITQAAKKLNVTQPALTQSLRVLERQLGVDLFERHHTGVKLTPAGEQFQRGALVLMQAAEQATGAVRRSKNTTRPLIIGIHGEPWRQVKSIIETFRRVCPEVEVVERRLGLTTQQYALDQGQVDAVFNVGVPDVGHYDVRHIRDEPRLVAVPNRHELSRAKDLTVEDVVDQEYVSFHPSVPVWSGDQFTLAAERGCVGRLSDHQAGSVEEVISALGRNLFISAPAETAYAVPASGWRWRSIAGLGSVSLALVTDVRNRHPGLATLREVASWTS